MLGCLVASWLNRSIDNLEASEFVSNATAFNFGIIPLGNVQNPFNLSSNGLNSIIPVLL